MSRSTLTNVLFSLISLAMIGLPFYQNGIFFDQGHLIFDTVSIACSAVALIIWAIWRTKQSSPFETQGNRKKSAALSSGSSGAVASHLTLNRYDAAFFVYVLLYVFTLAHTPDFTRALIGALDALALIFPYFLFRWGFPNRFGAQIVVFGIAISSVVVNVIGMANAWHALKLPSAFDFTFHRVTSVFQYHNAYGSFVAGASLMLLTYMSLTDLRKSWLTIFYAGAVSLNMAGLLVSDSRGALLFWLIALLLLIIGSQQRFESHSARGQLLLLFYVSAVGLGGGYHFLHAGILSAKASFGWLGIAVTFVLPMILVVAIRLSAYRIGNRLMRFITFRRLLPVGVLGFIVFGLLKFHAFLHKLQTYHVNQLSVSQRFIFWKDGLKIWEQSPIFGLGANSWHTLYEKFQTYPYYTSRSHSFLIDTLIEVGLLGLLALLSMIWPIVRETVWPYRRLEETGVSEQLTHPSLSSNPSPGESPDTPTGHDPTVAAYRSLSVLGLALFLHSVMDWDMSFSYLRILMTLGMSAGVALFASRGMAMSSKRHLAGERLKSVFSHKAVVYTSSGIGTIALLLGAFFGIQLFRANQIAASAQKIPASAATLTRFEKAHGLAPYDAEILADIASTENALANTPGMTTNAVQIDEQKALSTYESACRLAPYDANIQGVTAALAYHLGIFQTAYEHAKQAYEDAPFYPSNVSIAINGGTVYAMSIAQSQPKNSQLIFTDVLQLYQQYLTRDEVVHHLPSYLPPTNSYQLQPFDYDSLAAAALATKRPQEAIQLAQKTEASTDAHSKQLAQLIILMARHNQGQPVTIQQIVRFVAQNPGVRGSYTLLSNAIR